jgi:glycosyltransferase involved in cell wall biosynthesis
MKKPKVSIITPSYNQGEFIEETINSVISQTYENIEYLIIDGASTDSSLEVIAKYSASVSKVISEKDAGQSDAINKGIRLATGDLITWLNSDDLLEPQAIEQAVSTFIEHPEIDFVFGDVKLVDEDANQIGLLKGRQIRTPDVFFNLDLPIPQQGSIWRRHVTESVGLLDEQWHYVLDREFFLRICLSHNVKYINRTFGSFRQHGQSKSVTMKEAWIMELPSMYESLVKKSAWAFTGKDQISKIVLASAYIHAAYLALYAGKIGVGITNLLRACGIYPLILLHSHIYSKPLNKLKAYLGRKLENDRR